MAKVLVTGAAGFIGSHTCDRLLRDGHSIIGVDDFRTGRRANIASIEQNTRFSLFEFDVAAATKLDECVDRERPDAIVHLAALVSVPQSVADPELNFRQNVSATQHVIAAAQKHGIKRIAFASSAAIYGDNPELPLTERSETRPISPYGGAKLASEALLIAQGVTYGITVRCLRYFNVYGPRQDPKSPYSGVISIFWDQFRAGKPPTIFGDGEQTRDFISVHDVARANVVAATTPDLASGIVNICTGKSTSLNQLADILRQQFSQAPKPKYGPAREGDIRHSLGSPEKAKKELEFEATVTLEDGLAELAKTMR